MAVSDPAAHLSKDESGLRLVEVTTRVDVVKEIAILGQLKHQEGLLLCLYDLKDLNDVGVLHPLQNLNLSRKELGEVLFRGHLFVEILDGNLEKETNSSRNSIDSETGFMFQP